MQNATSKPLTVDNGLEMRNLGLSWNCKCRSTGLFSVTQKKGQELSVKPVFKMLWSAFPHYSPLGTITASPHTPIHNTPLYLQGDEFL